MLRPTSPLREIAPAGNPAETIRATNDPHVEWRLWQLLDSAFPTGGFAHSAGTEAARQHGEIRDRRELNDWIEASLRQTERGILPLVAAAHRAPERVEEWDRLCDVFTLNHVANRASRRQGRAFATNVERIFGVALGRLPSGEERFPPGSLTAQPEGGAVVPFAHLAPIFGVALALLGISELTALRIFVYQQLRGILAAAVRLSLVGPLEGQTLQLRFAPRAEAAAQLGASLTLDQLAQTCPLVDLLGSTHDHLDGRLFQS